MLRAELKSVGGQHDGKLISLDADRKFLIGREQDCHLRPNSESISRHHCGFTLDEFCLRLRDLGSTNGTAVNGESITSQVRLEQGDRVTVGPLEFEVVLSEVDEVVSEPETETTETDKPIEAEAETGAGDGVLDEPGEEPSSSDTMIDLPADAAAAIDDAANTAMLTDDTTVIPNQQQQHELQQQQLQQQMAMQQQMALQQQQQQQQQLAMQQHLAMQQQLALQQQLPFVGHPGMMPPGFVPPAPMVPQPVAEVPQPATPPADQSAPSADGLPEVSLPDPATTGAKDPEPAPAAEKSSEDGESKASEDENPSNMAEDIIKQYMHRRPSAGGQ